jgi:hypothetical protein
MYLGSVKMNPRGALLVYCPSVAHIFEEGICPPVCSIPGVKATTKVEFLIISSLTRPFLDPTMSLTEYLNFYGFFCAAGVPGCSSFTFLFLLIVNIIYNS